MYDKHPIQLVNVSYKKLSIEINQSKSNDNQEESSHLFKMRFAHSDYDHSQHIIGVKLNISIGYEYDEISQPLKMTDSEYWLEVTVGGIFKVDENSFPIDKIETWANSNAPLVLYSYAREAAYSLTNRINKDATAILPLLSVPTFKIVKNN